MNSPATAVIGVPEIDRALAPVLPAGWLGLIEGRPGGPASLLLKQAAYAARASVPVLFYTTVEPTGEVERGFDRFDEGVGEIRIIDLEAAVHQRTLQREIAVARSRARGLSLDDAVMGTASAAVQTPTPPLLSRLLLEVAPLDAPFRFVLDSLDPILEETPGPEVTRFARQLRHQASSVGGGALLLVHPEVPEPRTRAVLELLADFVVEAETRPSDSAHVPELTLRSVRHHPELVRRYPARFGPDGVVL